MCGVRDLWLTLSFNPWVMTFWSLFRLPQELENQSIKLSIHVLS